jgi:hypothetical protein
MRRLLPPRDLLERWLAPVGNDRTERPGKAGPVVTLTAGPVTGCLSPGFRATRICEGPARRPPAGPPNLARREIVSGRCPGRPRWFRSSTVAVQHSGGASPATGRRPPSEVVLASPSVKTSGSWHRSDRIANFVGHGAHDRHSPSSLIPTGRAPNLSSRGPAIKRRGSKKDAKSATEDMLHRGSDAHRFSFESGCCFG